ncbi:MAG: SufS family cysteine desulfurase [Actinobacteria bacterium]|uniref:cysteine desulfurase n=1 Tax=freshwater metagenome TaxID=449393 RepID=A0A6J6S6T6_9ZZZZ|nr:SufS family cysteine desulfurase [Actinomycetota bacterium]
MKPMFSPAEIRKDFPIFSKVVRGGNRLVYLDSGATSQKPRQVLDAERNFYEQNNAAVHRGAHLLAEEASIAYEGARQVLASFLNAELDEVIFTKSATESINALAYSFGNSTNGSRFALKPGDRIVVSELEHHANLIPWQQLAKRSGAELVWFSVDPEGRLDQSNLDELINASTKIVAITHQSNVLGTIVPLKDIVSRAHAVGAVVVLDACQSAPHFAIDVKALDIDFLAFSGHKALGPTGIGILWGRSEYLNEMEPFLTGGSMIESVTMTEAKWAPSPKRFEAGVPNMAQAVGFAAAINYLNDLGMDNVAKHEHELTAYALDKFLQLEKVEVIGPKNNIDRGSVISFTIEGIHPHDVGQVLDQYGVAVRTGHHCAWPLMRKLGLVGTTRASFYVYNDEADVDVLIDSILEAQKYFKV